MDKVKVIGGQMNYQNLTNKLQEKEYVIRKISIWLNMVNDGMKPTRWLKPNRSGTKVNFDYSISSKDEYEKALDELTVYINEVNRKFDLDIKLNRK